MSKPGVRTIVALVAAGLVAVAAVTTGVVAYAASNATEHDPQITAYANRETITVDPFLYCTVTMTDCRYGETAVLATKTGEPVQLSLPSQIAESPWLVQLIYQRPSGEQVDRVLSFADYTAGARALTIETLPEPELRLAGIEVQLPILARDTVTGRETYIPHAAWSISTPEA
ncbi:DUF2771 domain-containing protein [Nocardia asteroides]|uniref:DUF2771 domain-containing protein n=1 Tax=Nocardia asteroides NBRC 15531 TaxID=1110697 RepID=U5E3Q2_NOCAS|nr:DUF2771 domain-containing protein [Nocardia asteroides]TLF65331.1 DUF2771 domain-containing protein [Nocardia asteroides NBRC 15531]UGT47921.1 DUF2771 domain-containing protein [Nocardia asteroides]SFM59422.1 Protein of unknown function [Nocardia asteroides]VEG33145.1 Protein of uncharacterised function (DUF2771) [Nocardia asteroides]GAD82927.1 hypothetical protein NCAST_13_02020 [Nocardia asteroides NBRC 15531]